MPHKSYITETHESTLCPLKSWWSLSHLYATSSDTVWDLSQPCAHRDLQPVWSYIKLYCFPFLWILPACLAAAHSWHLSPRVEAPHYHPSSVRVSVLGLPALPALPVLGMVVQQKCREEPPLLFTFWAFRNTCGELQLEEWQNCVTAQAWFLQKCQRIETSFKMCLWVPLRHALTYIFWQPFPIFYVLGIPKGAFLL